MCVIAHSTHRLTLAAFAFFALFLSPLAPARGQASVKEFSNPAGWEWIVEPIARQPHRHEAYIADVRPGASSSPLTKLVVMMLEGKRKELVIVFVRPGTFERYFDFRPIAIDVDGKRHRLVARVAAGADNVMLARWESDPTTLPANQVAHVGLEGLTRSGFREKAMLAAKRAKAKGLKTLPFPDLNRPYRFRATDIAGNAIDSNDLRGKVVLLDLWATWCFPCMQKMPEMKEIYEQYHERGLEVVGVNLDETKEKCQFAAKRLELPWRQMMAPTDKNERDLWMEAMGVRTIPRLLLIDRRGVLRADCRPEELKSEIEKLLAQ